MESNNYSSEPDGSRVYADPFPYAGNWYYIDPTNPKRLVPKVDPCPYRVINLRVLQCGKRRDDWTCSILCKSVSIPTCQSCTLETSGST